ncbi:NitT/TauT family transport system substrate-binding protein [Desulfocicer vacuolatum DSM 3385]|uniref:Thiamine pyrimidine synthase n=1 Tax=Desulfocicer vacuolatum DSM 3385 TaxID=1121400 RepID=A0A1W2E8V5_9BACT|nr:ABC transporter substrate-binding protein [Desulfocicer vacuolatum]SMD06210.1 NitT/TauT family transport system substrate-binding protein [Desulfocicer vacuolatum DSM 3385]
MKKNIIHLFFILFISCTVFAISTVSPCRATENLNYRLKWLFNASVTGDILAEDQGLFAKEGLTVSVKAGGPERDAIRELEMGYAAFGVASADQVIRARAKGAPVVVIAQLFQINPLQWISKTNKPVINKVEDLRGRIVGITYGGNDETIMKTLLARGGIKENELTLASVRYDYTPFYMDKIEVWPVYKNAQGIIIGEKLKKAGEDIRFFNPGDHGVQFVANSVVTSEKMVKHHPDIVARFKKALLKGWQTAMDPANQDLALGILQKYDKDTPGVLQEKQLISTRKLVWPDRSKKIGHINVKAWQQTEQIMLEQGLIKSGVDIKTALILP